MKLARRRIGPFRVTAVYPNSIELDVPAALKLHQRINVEYVDLYKGPRHPDRLANYKYQPGPRMVKGNDGQGNAEYVVEGILGHRPLMEGDRALHFPDGTPAYEYWVLWSGYEVDDDWEPLEMFGHAKEIINSYHRHQKLARPSGARRPFEAFPLLPAPPVGYLVFALFRRESLSGTQGSAEARRW
eukprot:jgi/Botrbrau1/16956/Bobra.49_2s0019.1